MDVMVLLGRRLRSLRVARGLTQQELGEQVGMSYKYLGSMERGQENPSVKVLAKVAKGLGVELQEFFVFQHEETSPPKLRKELDRLMKGADVATLRQAVKLLRALLR